MLKKLLHPVLKKCADIYLQKTRSYCYKNIQVDVYPGVFYPPFFLSTKLLLDFLQTYNLAGKTFLELGGGSGIISILAAKKEAKVTASDINPLAVKNIQHNKSINHVTLQTVQSDLFDQIENQIFDYIVINPPYYPKQPKTDKEYAYFCGEHFEYFTRLFKQLSDYINRDSEVIMILSEDCAIDTIQDIASKEGFEFKQLIKKKVKMEWNYIFSIKKMANF